MQENDRPLFKALAPDAVQQTGHGLAGIHRVQQQTFLAGQKFDRREGASVWLAITRPEILVPQGDLEGLRNSHAEQLGSALGQALHLGQLRLLGTRHRDADHRQLRQCFAQGQGQAAVGAGTARGKHHGGKFNAAVFNLRGQLQPGAHVAQRAECIGTADRHQVRLLAVTAQAVGEGVELVVGVVEVFHQLHFGVEQLQQQAIAVAQVVGVVGAGRILQQGNTAQAELGSQRGGLAHMVGLDRAGGDQGIGALSDGVGGQVFEFAQLVAAHGQRRGVIAFDVDVPAQPSRQPLEFFQGRGTAQ